MQPELGGRNIELGGWNPPTPVNSTPAYINAPIDFEANAAWADILKNVHLYSLLDLLPLDFICEKEVRQVIHCCIGPSVLWCKLQCIRTLNAKNNTAPTQSAVIVGWYGSLDGWLMRNLSDNQQEGGRDAIQPIAMPQQTDRALDSWYNVSELKSPPTSFGRQPMKSIVTPCRPAVCRPRTWTWTRVYRNMAWNESACSSQSTNHRIMSENRTRSTFAFYMVWCL